ncbi:G-type lectin S-receptor-like serine/threonine-protein kinase At1g11410 isoform X1 [Rosa chinensis]|uniref:G-type lectin S-receptor-like serine/threonine-protein kinase At1g11410 isoform X1 n=2 Tax=Rosa chinensis TaxID=74649 RepID=UPI000D08A136|nr:G-type lectin S-receptor-like serine/threonine-protein kinase At1g11410 isoform X1 [Rosa chinensis]
MSFSSEAFIQILLIFLLLPSSICQLPLDTLTPNQPIRDGDVLVSSRKLFALGFFSPGNPQHRHVGVWFYKVPEKTIVWVANRNHPVNDSSGVLSISGDGGLVIHGKDQSTPLWSANVTLSSPNNFTAKLRDTGNLVLLENGNQRVVWDSFDYPSDTVLSSMKLGLDRRSGLEWLITSWKSKDDPGTGSCTYGIDPRGSPQLFLKKEGGPLWRSGPWIGDRWSGEPQLSSTVGLFNLSFVNNEDEISYKRVVANDSLFTRGVLDESGIYQRLMWNDKENKWIELVSDPNEWCDNYGLCGPNSNCDPYNDYKFACTCQPGFEPKSPSDWYLRIGVGGCIRKAGVSVCRNGEGFVPVNRVKVPDSSTAVRVNMSLSLEACKLECLMDCSCTAYTSADERGGGNGCLTWHGDLMDTRTYPKVGQDLYVRVDATSLAQYEKSNGSLSKKATLAISLGSVTVFLLLLTLYWLVSMKMKGNRRRNKCSFILTAGSTYFEESSGGTAFDDSRINSELAFFHLKTITTATNNFSIENKLGEGGFGSVYKGILHNGKEIAVKRLSKFSGQGVEEFKNEILLIAKLQHRNLVRILGCCVEDEEKILIYEYLPNKSLDSFIFNETKRALLNWTKRFEIIFGIARGILYLHEDSRLRIIHRDLKASNVLLDNSLNPKIADFGMARIFSGEQSEANTNRVVGTYGYMSPEYAMEGLFSIKSDVYSFGVLLLEIITGKKNVGYYHEEYPNSNLVGHVWDLWKEGRAVEIFDSSIEEYLVSEVVRCIQIGLLCVQEYATDRPTMSAVVSMLGNDAALPSPRRPAFLLKRMTPSGEPSSGEGANSVNDVTCTIVEGR